MKIIAPIIFIFACFSCHASVPIRILAWNIESGGSDLGVIISQLKSEMPAYDVVALSEVPSNAIQPIAKALGWQHFGGSRGGEDRLMLAWSNRFKAIEQTEIRRVGKDEFPAGGNRAPIIANLEDTKTGKKLWVMNNHLTRGKEENRNKQAELLVDWVQGIKEPVIAVGDYNMDFDFHTRAGNQAFEIFQAGDHWKWIVPKQLVDTNWSDPDGDGKDNYPDSMLDFVFVNDAAQSWVISCEVVVRDGDFPDDDTTSDHRPVLTTIDF